MIYKPCPFCGSQPILDIGGSCVDIECEGCGIPSISVQISDQMTIEERLEERNRIFRIRVHQRTIHHYTEEYIQRAVKEAYKQWESRYE